MLQNPNYLTKPFYYSTINKNKHTVSNKHVNL